MGDKTGIEWTDATWNPVVGCSIISPGCTNCYAMKMAGRLEAMGSHIYRGHTVKTKTGFVWNGTVLKSNWGQTIKPLSWKRPRRIFVNSMSDLFHEALPDSVIDQVFAIMAMCPQHTFQVLTKRAERMKDYMAHVARGAIWQGEVAELLGCHETALKQYRLILKRPQPWSPLPNVLLGVSVEDPERKSRIDFLRETVATRRFLSVEPLLADLGTVDLTGVSWVIVGGESGAGARDFNVDWAGSIVRQCKAAGVPVFVKQLGAKPYTELPPTGEMAQDQVRRERFGFKDRKGGDWSEWPPYLRVREFPA